LQHGFAEGFFGVADAGTDGVVAFAEGFEEIGKSAEGASDAPASGEGEGKPAEDEGGVDQVLVAGFVVAEVEEGGAGGDGGESGGEGEEEDSVFVA
jgi:hypothetical protein